MKKYIILLLSISCSVVFAQERNKTGRDYKYHVEYILSASKYQKVKKMFSETLKNPNTLNGIIKYNSYTDCNSKDVLEIVLKPNKVIIDLGYDKENGCLKNLKALSDKISKIK